MGMYQYAENLSNVNANVWDGKLSTGTYAWWAPYDSGDSEFRTVQDHNNHDFPGIIISGSFIPGTNSSGQLPVNDVTSSALRVIVRTTYEFTTKSTAWQTQTCIGRQSIIDDAAEILSRQPHCMSNKKHEGFIAGLMKGMGLGSAKDFGSTIKSVASMALPFIF